MCIRDRFGTGAVKITPAHDPNDFEVGKRHNLPEINVMNDDATINENGGKYAGMERYEARKAIVHDLEEQDVYKRQAVALRFFGTFISARTLRMPRMISL